MTFISVSVSFPVMATYAADLTWDEATTFAKPTDAKGDPSNKMLYFSAGPVFVDLHNAAIIKPSLNKDATPEQRAASALELTVALTDDQVTGGMFKTPDSNDKTLFVRVPDGAVQGLRQFDEAAKEVVYAKHVEWLGLPQPVNRERYDSDDKDIRIWKPIIEPPKDADKDGWTMTLAVYADDEDLTILQQSRFNPRDFTSKTIDKATGKKRSLTVTDIPKGARFTCTVSIGGLRLKKSSMSMMRPIIKTVWLLNQGGRAPPKDAMMDDIQVKDDVDEEDVSAAVSGTASYAPDVDAALAKSEQAMAAADGKEE